MVLSDSRPIEDGFMHTKTNIGLGLQTFLCSRSVSGPSSAFWGLAMCLVGSTSSKAFFSFQCCQQQAAVLKSPVRNAQSRVQVYPFVKGQNLVCGISRNLPISGIFMLFRIRKVVDGYTFHILAIVAAYPSWTTSNNVYRNVFLSLSDLSVLLMRSRTHRSSGKNFSKTARILAILTGFKVK